MDMATANSTPAVRLEFRHADGRPSFYDMTGDEFIVGSTPGCDVRLAGSNLPPIVCILSRHAGGVRIRKIGPTTPLLLNGKSFTSAELNSGDTIELGTMSIGVQISAAPAGPRGVSFVPVMQSTSAQAEAELQQRRVKLDEQVAELEADRVLWYRRREALESECREREAVLADLKRQAAEIESQRQSSSESKEEVALALGQRESQLKAQSQELARQKQELEAQRAEIAEMRRDWQQRYQERRDRLAGVQQAIQVATQKVQERKRTIDAEESALKTRIQDTEARGADLERREQALAKSWEEFAHARQSEEQARIEMTERVNVALEQAAARESECGRLELDLKTRETQYLADLARLDRHLETLEHRERQAEAQSADAEKQREQLRRDSLDLEEQARQLDAATAAHRDQVESFAAERAEFQSSAAQLKERAAQIEGQQAMLAAMRARLERTRDEVRNEAQQLAEQRVRQEAAERELKEKARVTEERLASIEAENESHNWSRQQFESRSAELQNAVERLRELQDRLSEQEAALQQREEAVQRQAAEHAAQSAELKAKTDQLLETQQSLAADRQALLEREAAITETEETRKSLQEQLLRRAEEVAGRLKQVEDREREHEARAAQVGEEKELTIRQRHEAETAVAAARRELERQMEEIQRQAQRVGDAEAIVRRQTDRIKSAGRALAAGRKSQSQARQQWLARRRVADAESEKVRQELLEIQRQIAADAAALQRQLPDLELRGQAVLIRLGQAREEIRGHLAELHEYARQSHEDLEDLRAQVRAEGDRLRDQAIAIKRARAEHRLAVAAFRQQLLEWQNRTADMRRMLSDDGTRLEWKQAEVAAAAKQVDETAQSLAKQAADLHEQERQVGEKRGEMERHLSDMREWYRRKLRELAQGNGSGHGIEAVRSQSVERPEPDIVEMPNRATADAAPTAEADAAQPPDVLSLTSDLDPGDRQLGELLRSLELIDGETLAALLLEARRQRKSLRQVLLSARGSGTPMLTLYQLALIESGNLDALVLGPTRVIDRLQSTAHEAVFRVFDPRRAANGQSTAMLRHLAEAVMKHGEHVVDFRERFTALAAISDPNLAATFEVLEINGRPAVLQEWLIGLPSNEWPAAVASPTVWRRLVTQAAQGLEAAHRSGLVHGRLGPRSVILTADGTVKVMGCGEPPWLSGTGRDGSVADDLMALGELAAKWSTIAPRRKGARAPKPLPDCLQLVVSRMRSDAEGRYESAAEVVAGLEATKDELPDSADAWDKLIRRSADDVGEAVRKSA